MGFLTINGQIVAGTVPSDATVTEQVDLLAERKFAKIQRDYIFQPKSKSKVMRSLIAAECNKKKRDKERKVENE